MAISSRKVRACARNMVETCNLKRGENTIVRGGAHAQELLEEISLECYRKGALPMIIITSDRYSKAVFDEIPSSTLATTPKHYVGMVKSADTLIAVEEIDDPRVAEGFPRAKLAARQKAMLPVVDIVNHPKRGKKWLYAGWPTKAAARRYGIPFEQYEKTVIGGISVSPKELMSIGKKMAARFRGASWVHVWDDEGTDFKVNVAGRRGNIDDGFISASDFNVGDRGANLPAGEFFFAPRETVGEGTIYCPLTQDRMSGKLVEGVRLKFRRGRLLLEEAEARNNLDQLVASFKECEKIDKGKYSRVRTLNLGELGIGFNPKIKKAIGYILTDEKIAGTVHLAFGFNKSYGGTSESIMHWDFVSAPGVNIEVKRRSGKITPVMIKGRLV
ncbi:MAG: aminopeptidase [Methanobacteriota archaeon]|nr:MAG: aminopeptidase [Euryarchaeota archaeon]